MEAWYPSQMSNKVSLILTDLKTNYEAASLFAGIIHTVDANAKMEKEHTHISGKVVPTLKG